MLYTGRCPPPGHRRPHGCTGGGVGVDAAVHLQHDGQAAAVQFGPHGGQTFGGLGQEGLTAETGLHAHDEHQVHLVQVIEQFFHRCAGTDAQAGAAAQFPDGAQHSPGVLAHPFGFQVNGDEVCPRRGEILGVEGRVLDHQVHVVEGIRQGLVQAAEYRGTIADVGDEVAVHHVDVQHIRAGIQGGTALRGQIGKVGRQDRYAQFCLHSSKFLYP